MTSIEPFASLTVSTLVRTIVIKKSNLIASESCPESERVNHDSLHSSYSGAYHMVGLKIK